jgi:hypothetical protein
MSRVRFFSLLAVLGLAVTLFSGEAEARGRRGRGCGGCSSGCGSYSGGCGGYYGGCGGYYGGCGMSYSYGGCGSGYYYGRPGMMPGGGRPAEPIAKPVEKKAGE